MRCLLLLASFLLAAPAAAEVKRATPASFELEHRTTLALPPEAAWLLLVDIGRWWNPSHTYSGKPANLSLELKPGACFCEKTDSGGIEHLRVVYVDRPKRVVLTGGLGPLLFDAVSGVLDLRFEPSGAGSSLVLNYRVAGFAAEDASRLAPVVDRVLGEQVARLAAAAKR